MSSNPSTAKRKKKTPKKEKWKLLMVVHACNPSTPEAEAGGL
jgi:hypothetical protein